MFHKDFKEFVELLNANEVEYLVVGGYAVSFYGYPRYTGDLDIWINISKENIQKALKVIDDFGLASIGLTEKDFINPNTIIQFGFPPIRIDILLSIDGINFEEAFRNKNKINFNGLDINFIDIDDLIVNKKASGRYKDLDDIEHLKSR